MSINTTLNNITPKQHIIIKNAKVHNLKGIDIVIPRNKLVVITGVSGSGKSSLTIDTLYAEGQRRYVESLSSYARQFLMRMSKPDVEYIKGVSPAIAIEQKVVTRNARSTVGTLTEIYDYLRLLFSRIGETYSPISGKKVKKHEVSDVVDYVYSLPAGSKIMILIPLHLNKKEPLQVQLSSLLQKGFNRLYINPYLIRIEDIGTEITEEELLSYQNVKILIDRVVLNSEDSNLKTRIADSVQTAFYESRGTCFIAVFAHRTREFSNRFELDGMTFEDPNPHFFNFNSPYGACPTCEGFGHTIGIDENLVIPDRSLSIYEGAIACWAGEKMGRWRDTMITYAQQSDLPIHRPISQLTDKQYKLLWTGNKYFKGLDAFFEELKQKSAKIQYRVLLARYRGRTPCRDCKQTRLRKDAQYVKVDGKSITDLVLMPIKVLAPFFKEIEITDYQREVAHRILLEINNRLAVMQQIGLDYLTLNRLSNTLSGGETQRINLTRSLGSNLTNSMYILDEPSIGLHPRDTQRLIGVLKLLRNLGNTVIVVEHEEEVIRAADYIVDIGPMAGHLGGEVVFAGPAKDLPNSTASLTAQYLTGKQTIALPRKRRNFVTWFEIIKATQHNLKGISVMFPLNLITVVTGVSGSGKTTLVKNILYPAIKRKLEQTGDAPGAHKKMLGDVNNLTKIVMVDQKPLGKSSRSNPVTYIKAYDAIRKLFAKQKLAQMRAFQAKHFSFNIEGGRCETCKGEGFVTIEMQFLADVKLVCEACNGKRFKPEVLDVKHKEKNIFEVLELNVDQAMEFFVDSKEVIRRMKPLQDVGLGYVKLGQSSSTLSGGEAQRVKLASFLSKGRGKEKIMFLFDEPSTGLHFHDIKKLLKSFNALVENGHTIVIIEHNVDIIKSADWLIDLGPEGGDEGGFLLYQGVPERLLRCKNSYTADYLRDKL